MPTEEGILSYLKLELDSVANGYTRTEAFEWIMVRWSAVEMQRFKYRVESCNVRERCGYAPLPRAPRVNNGMIFKPSREIVSVVFCLVFVLWRLLPLFLSLSPLLLRPPAFDARGVKKVAVTGPWNSRSEYSTARVFPLLGTFRVSKETGLACSAAILFGNRSSRTPCKL